MYPYGFMAKSSRGVCWHWQVIIPLGLNVWYFTFIYNCCSCTVKIIEKKTVFFFLNVINICAHTCSITWALDWSCQLFHWGLQSKSLCIWYIDGFCYEVIILSPSAMSFFLLNCADVRSSIIWWPNCLFYIFVAFINVHGQRPLMSSLTGE